MKKSKKICLVFLIAAFNVLPAAGYLCGCENEAKPAGQQQQAQLPQQQNEQNEQNEQEGTTVKVDYEVIPYEAMPDNVKMLVDGHKKEATVEIVAVNQSKYVFIALGARPTGGYSVSIKSVTEHHGRITVAYSEQKPEKGAMVTQAFTYPWIAIKIDTELPIDTVSE